MSTLVEVAKLVKDGTKSTQEGNKAVVTELVSIEKKFEKFFKLQERDRLDRLEDRLENKRSRSSGGGGNASAAAAAAALAARNRKALEEAQNKSQGMFTDLEKALLFLATPKKWIGAILKAGPKLALAGVGIGAAALNNTIADRLKTQRGLLRLEAKELIDATKIQKQRLRAELKIANEKALLAKIELRETISRARLDAESTAAAKNTAIEKAKQVRANSLEERARVMAELKENARVKAELKAARFKARTDNLRTTVFNSRVNLIDDMPNTAIEKGRANAIGGNRIRPISASALSARDAQTGSSRTARLAPGPDVMTSLPRLGLSTHDALQERAMAKLNGFTDADVRAAGFRVLKNGAFLETNGKFTTFRSPEYVLKTLKARPATFGQGRSNAGGFTNRRAAMGLNAVSAIVDPVGTAAYVGLEQASIKMTSTSSKALQVTGKILGTGLKIAGSTVGLAAQLALFGTATADGTVSGPIDNKYAEMLTAILNGDLAGVARIREEMMATRDDGTGSNFTFLDYYMSNAREEQQGLFNFIAKGKKQDVDAFIRLHSTKHTGRIVNRSKSTVAAARYGSGGKGRNGNVLILPGDELSALDIISQERQAMGQTQQSLPAPVTVNNNNSTSQQIETFMFPNGGTADPNDTYDLRFQFIH